MRFFDRFKKDLNKKDLNKEDLNREEPHEDNWEDVFLGDGLVEIKTTFTTRCSARCVTCLNCTIENQFDIEVEVFKDLVNQVIEMSEHIKNPLYFSFFNVGESFLHKDFMDMCNWAIPKMKEHNIRTSIVTNGSHIKEIPEGIDDFFISFNAGKKETYEEITKMNYDEVRQNILRLYHSGEFKKAANVQIHMLCFDANQGQEKDFKETFKELKGVKCRFSYKYDNQHEETDYKGIEEKPSRVPCDYLTNKINIYPNGDVHLCAHDFKDTVVFGNLKNSSLNKILNSEKRKNLIEQHKAGNFTGICEKCDYNCDMEDMEKWFVYDVFGE